MILDGRAYHYDLKDHLGNSRVTFSSKPVTTTAMASMEISAAPEEEEAFKGVAESRQTLAFHNTTDPSIQEPAPQQVATLMPGEQGPSKSLQVHSGDTVRLKVNARYETTPQQVQGLEGVATEVVGAVQKTASGLESSGASEGLNGLGATGALANDQAEKPQAHLNYLVYDEDYQLVDQGFVAVSEAAAVGKNNPDAAPEELALEVPIEEDGFVYAYLSNGVANSGTPVHFDDFTVEQQSYIVAVNDFYPGGLLHQQFLSSQLPSNYLWSGKERTLNLGLHWDDFGNRRYMPDLMRWTSVDPAADVLEMSTPYAYALNNPINYIDPDGELPIFINGRVWSSSERGDQSYWDAQLLSTIRNSGIPNPGGEEFYVDGDRYATSFSRRDGKPIAAGGTVLFGVDFSLGAGNLPSGRHGAGYWEGKRDFDKILGMLERDPESGKIIEKIQIYTHSRGAAFATGYTEALLKQISEHAGQFADPTNVIEYILHLAPHQSGSLSAVSDNEYSIHHDDDLFSGNNMKGVKGAFSSDQGDGAIGAHSTSSFVKDVNAFLGAFQGSSTSNNVVNSFVKKMKDEYGIDVTVK